MDQPSILVRILHSVPHVNVTFRRVNDTFDPESKVYLESLGILASIPAALLILSLIGFLLYLLTRCCDRKQRKPGSQRCQNCTLITITLLCCAAIGLGLYGNDDFHNGLLQAFNSGRQVENLVSNLKIQTETIKYDLDSKVQPHKLEVAIEKPSYNQTAVSLLLDTCKWVKDNTSSAVASLNTVLYFMKPSESEISLKNILNQGEFYESIRWPATLGYLTALLLLCTVLVIGLARRSRCALIFFSVLGLFGIIICWLLAGIYLATSVTLGDFCMRPTDFMCRQVALQSPDDVYYLNCGTLRNRFILRLNESRDFVEKAKESVHKVARMSREIYPRIETSSTTDSMSKDLEETKRMLSVLSAMLDRRSIDKHYAAALRGICGGGLFGLSLMMVAGLLTAILLTILVYADSHAWIYLTKRPPEVDKSETAPLFQEPARCPTSPVAGAGIGTINRTLLHHQQNHAIPSAPLSTTSATSHHKNGSAGYRGLVPTTSTTYAGDSPPPDYNELVHGKSRSGHHTLGRLPSQQTSMLSGPNNGKYATLSKQCSSTLKTQHSNTLTLPNRKTSSDKTADKESMSEKDPRDVTNNGFNRFDPKYISIGPKAIRGNSNLSAVAAATANKCATLRHGGRYGGSLTMKGASPSPNLKSAKTPSIATVSKDYSQHPNCSTLPYKKSNLNTFSDIPGANPTGSGGVGMLSQKELTFKEPDVKAQPQQYQQQPQTHQLHAQQHQQQSQRLEQQHSHQQQQNQQQQQHESHHQQPIQQPTVYSIETSNYRSSSGKLSKGISILNQPLPDIPPSSLKMPDITKNTSQPLCAANLNNYRSLQRPSRSQLRESRQASSDVATHQQQHPSKATPPSLPPKNRHKDDQQQSSRTNRQYNTQTLPSSKSSNLSRHSQQQQQQQQQQSQQHPSTHSTFGYDREHNIGQSEKVSSRYQESSRSGGAGVPYVEQYKSNLSSASKQQQQQQQHQQSSRHSSSNVSSSHHHSHQQNNNLPSYQSSHHSQSHHQSSSSNKNYDQQSQQQPPSNVYYRSLKRGGTHANSDLYSVTEL